MNFLRQYVQDLASHVVTYQIELFGFNIIMEQYWILGCDAVCSSKKKIHACCLPWHAIEP
jgi:hypothetical protein